MPKNILTPWQFGDALVKAGIFTKEEINHIRRIVIDINGMNNGPVTMYIERYVDEKLLEVITTIDGIKIVKPKEAGNA